MTAGPGQTITAQFDFSSIEGEFIGAIGFAFDGGIAETELQADLGTTAGAGDLLSATFSFPANDAGNGATFNIIPRITITSTNASVFATIKVLEGTNDFTRIDLLTYTAATGRPTGGVTRHQDPVVAGDVSAIPAPAPILMLLSGFAALGVFRRVSGASRATARVAA
ncbi:MAG: hypothetical protein AAF192_18230 [Pseudomonadota bacterium]